MPLKDNPTRKLYYSIKEVAAMVGEPESTLRFWEKEFPTLKPKTGGNNIRQYSEKDIELVKLIHNLLRVRGFKIAAARKFINGNRAGADRSADVLDTLISVRDQLKELKRMVDGLV